MSEKPVSATAASLARPGASLFCCLMKTIDEMLNLDLLTAEQHHDISAWIAQADTPEEILKMPAPLWQAVERASQIMGVDADLTRPASLDAGDGVVL